ncbi:DEAD/DEAH box helicase family protein [Acinetobacter sp. VNK23]|uniref:DEAD/DEAH box helicase family protein n=1 Tax=Acinetobacter thutiue TaxID=2998078 RepID=UPI002575C35B|nr:DEAD/DEAH box helicase family protein [Acinetobacter thutiue]MDM1021577.1 DEAD/DEAH box helicase family protein [Acinetobacter thutiue]
MSIFEKNFTLKPENVLGSLDQLIDALKGLSEITLYFKQVLAGEIELDLPEAKKILSFAERDQDNELLSEVADFAYLHSVQRLDESLRAFIVKDTPTDSLAKIHAAIAYLACEDELIEYVTKKGKPLLVLSLENVGVKDAKQYDPYAFIYNGQTLVRAKHIAEIPDGLLTENQVLVKGALSNVTDTDSSVAQLSELRRRSRGPAIPEPESGGNGAAPQTAGTVATGQGLYRNGDISLPEVNDAGLPGTGNRGNEPTDGRGTTDPTGADRIGSGQAGNTRPSTRSKRDRSIIQSAKSSRVELDAKAQLQAAAEGTPTEWGDQQNINEALPYLLTEQCDDVAKGEKRLIQDNANGVLFTNGTGTGKTFTGLGIVKRFLNAGLNNILIVTLSDKIANDFIKSGKPLNINIHQLLNTDDNGSENNNVVVTTYANFGQNKSLGKKDWDLIIVDESHTLMQSADGDVTSALANLRALSGHHAGFDTWAKMRFAERDPFVIPKEERTEQAVTDWYAFIHDYRLEWEKNWTNQTGKRAKVVFLSATPFAYIKTVDWAEGYLFNFKEPANQFKHDDVGGYNSGGSREKFYMSNFGYRMRYNKLTRPVGGVDEGVFERQFAEGLKKSGAMSGRELQLKFDYDRKFVLIKSNIGQKIDEGLDYLSDSKDEKGDRKYSELSQLVNKRFDYLSRRRLLEAIKAEEGLPFFKKNIALGRKVIIFHDYNEGGGFRPFAFVDHQFNSAKNGDYNDIAAAEYELFCQERPDLIRLNCNYNSPLVTLRRAFPKALLFNGRISKKERQKNVDLFNQDNSGFDLLIVQSDTGSTGISLHDTTGTHQRVNINIGQPIKPAKLRQTEGRIYRVGQASNAIQRYFTTGTNWERMAFAETIAGRAETVDNLAKGEDALVSIKQALIQAYEEADYHEPSLLDGIGGKAYDEENARIARLSPFDKAMTYYHAKGKRTESRQNREGKEWYATPEPLGYKMLEWAGVHTGDDVLEPSAGDGAIGRFAPNDVNLTMIEPTESLASRAKMANTGANVIIGGFEVHGTNNKYHAIVMNPPFGHAGSLALTHVKKAFDHLYDGGRIVAIIPRGSMDDKFSDWIADEKEAYVFGEMSLPQSTFRNAGTGVNTRIVIIERHSNPEDAPGFPRNMNFSHAESPEQLFEMIRHAQVKPRKLRIDEQLDRYGLYMRTERSNYIFNGDGLNVDYIKKILTDYWFADVNEYGEVVMPYNKSVEIIKKIKELESSQLAA